MGGGGHGLTRAGADGRGLDGLGRWWVVFAGRGAAGVMVEVEVGR